MRKDRTAMTLDFLWNKKQPGDLNCHPVVIRIGVT